MSVSSSTADVFLMSPPRRDWRIRGHANVFSQAALTEPTEVAEGVALREWLSLADAMTAAGATIALLPPPTDDTLTGMPYTAEAGHLGRDENGPVFLLPRVKPTHRRGEAPLIAALMASWGVRTWVPPVLWEGQGDVIDVGDGRTVCTSGDGPCARSSEEAYAHIEPFLPGPSIHIRFHADPWFHGNTFLGFFHQPLRANEPAPRCIVALVCEDALLPGEMGRLRTFLPDIRFVPIRREDSLRYPTNALQIGGNVLAPRGVPALAEEVWRDLGLEVVPLELPRLFGKGGGAAVCMTNRLLLSSSSIPRGALYAGARDALWRECRAS